MPKIAILVGNKLRDLPGSVLLASELCRQGAICCLLQTQRPKGLYSLAPDLVLVNSIRDRKLKLMTRLLDAGIGVALLASEGWSQGGLEEFRRRNFVPDPDLRRRLTGFYSWGPAIADAVQDWDWYSKHQVHVTGAPRFDFYVDPWRKAALRMSKYAAGYPTPIVLINGNFSIANPARRGSGSKAEKMSQNLNSMIRRLNASEAQVQCILDSVSDSFRKMVVLVNNLAAALPSVTFIYRPHPFEDHAAYRTLFKQRDNLHVVAQGAVEGWILRANVVIQRGCTTAIEAGLAATPTLSPQWIPSLFSKNESDRASIACASEMELIRKIEQILNGSFSLPEDTLSNLSDVVQKWFYRMDGNSHRRVANQILDDIPEYDESRRNLSCMRVMAEQSRARIKLNNIDSPDGIGFLDKTEIANIITGIEGVHAAGQDIAGIPIEVAQADDADSISAEFPVEDAIRLQGFRP